MEKSHPKNRYNRFNYHDYRMKPGMLFFCTAMICLLVANGRASTPMPPLATGHDNSSGLVFSADGTRAFWTAWNGPWGGDGATSRTIFSANYDGAHWSLPEPMPFTGSFNDDDPFVSPDNRWLYFVSTRPRVDGQEANADIWRYQFAPPHRLEPLAINSEQAEYSPVVTLSGALYFASARTAGLGRGDLYRAAPSGDGFASPINLGPAVNSHTGEWNLWVSPTEDEMLFEASSRPSNRSVPGDLYYSRNSLTGWTSAFPVSVLNGDGSDLLPRLSPDKKNLLYTRAQIGGHASIASIEWANVRASVEAQLAPELVVANRSSHNISFVDIAKGADISRIDVGEGPHLLSNVVDDKVLATGFGEFPEAHASPVSQRPPFVTALNSRVAIIDLAERRKLSDTALPRCARPHASWMVGERGFVTCQDEQSVLEFDVSSGRETRRYDTQQAGSHVLAYEPSSRTLSVSNTDSGSVTLIDIDSGEARVLELGGGSEGALAYRGRIWVANAEQGTVSVVDPVTNAVIHHTERLCGFPISLSPGPGNQVWLACFGTSELLSLDGESLEVEQRIALGAQPLNVILHPTHTTAYISLPRENAVAEVNLHAGMIVRRIPVGIEPDGLRWSKKTR